MPLKPGEPGNKLLDIDELQTSASDLLKVENKIGDSGNVLMLGHGSFTGDEALAQEPDATTGGGSEDGLLVTIVLEDGSILKRVLPLPMHQDDDV